MFLEAFGLEKEAHGASLTGAESTRCGGQRPEQSSLFSPSTQTPFPSFATGGFSFIFQAAPHPSKAEPGLTIPTKPTFSVTSLITQHKGLSPI